MIVRNRSIRQMGLNRNSFLDLKNRKTPSTDIYLRKMIGNKLFFCLLLLFIENYLNLNKTHDEKK